MIQQLFEAEETIVNGDPEVSLSGICSSEHSLCFVPAVGVYPFLLIPRLPRLPHPSHFFCGNTVVVLSFGAPSSPKLWPFVLKKTKSSTKTAIHPDISCKLII